MNTCEICGNNKGILREIKTADGPITKIICKGCSYHIKDIK